MLNGLSHPGDPKVSIFILFFKCKILRLWYVCTLKSTTTVKIKLSFENPLQASHFPPPSLILRYHYKFVCILQNYRRVELSICTLFGLLSLSVKYFQIHPCMLSAVHSFFLNECYFTVVCPFSY